MSVIPAIVWRDLLKNIAGGDVSGIRDRFSSRYPEPLELILFAIILLPDKLPLKLPINIEELITDAVTLVKFAVLGVVVPIATPSNVDG